MHYGDGKFFVRSYFRFIIVHYKEDKNIIFDWYAPGKFQKGVWYEGYADIPLVNSVWTNGTWDHYLVSPLASIFLNNMMERYDIRPVD